MQKRDFFYDLPPELIAQTPPLQRDGSRMLVANRRNGALNHRAFHALPDYLQPGDCLILNNTRVLPARLYGLREDTNAAVEFLLLRNLGGGLWETLCGPGKKAKEGSRFRFGNGIMHAQVEKVQPDGNRVVRFSFEGEFFALLDKIGEMPLPHYITERLEDAERYQTVYATQRGSAAAPTAGLHFTPEMLETVQKQGVSVAYVTLHVGLGTFRPVKAENITDHHMHAEYYALPPETAATINQTKANGGRVIAVGTTCCRTLETAARELQRDVPLQPCAGWTDIFIYPGYNFRCIDGLLTNFHLPESTLIMLVSAFLGYGNTMAAYRAAVQERYRFFSFGDCMLII